MDELLKLEKVSYRIAIYMVFFALGVQVACYLAEKRASDMPVVFVPSPCKECEEKRKEREIHRNG